MIITVNNKSIRFGKVIDGYINLITDFNIFNYPNLIKILRDDPEVEDVYSVQNFTTTLGGMALIVKSDFNYLRFSERLFSYLSSM